MQTAIYAAATLKNISTCEGNLRVLIKSGPLPGLLG